MSWHRPIGLGAQRFYWSAMAHGQTSPHTLYGSERISIGGRSSVRGFHEDTITGDRGLYIRNELGWNLPWFESLKQSETIYGLQLYTAYDCGFIKKDRHDPYERGTMQGVAVGLRSLGDLSLDVTLSKATDAPNFIKARGSEVYAVISYKI